METRHNPNQLLAANGVPNDVPNNRLQSIGKITFMMGSVTFIVIGVLHTMAQLTYMSDTKIRADLESIGIVEGSSATAWELWMGLGLLMGFFSMALGLANLAGLRSTPTGNPAFGVCIVNVLMLVTITAVGALFLGPTQMVGGPVGVAMFGLPAWNALRNR